MADKIKGIPEGKKGFWWYFNWTFIGVISATLVVGIVLALCNI